MTKAWYLIQSKPRQEAVAETHLARQAYTVYLPWHQVTKRKRQQLVASKEPMFARYLFIQLDQGVDNWAPIRSTRGVQNLVRFGGMPARLPDQLIACLYEREHQNEHTEPVQTFQEGQIVRLMDGPLRGYEAIFKATSGQQRAYVLLDLLGGRPTFRLT